MKRIILNILFDFMVILLIPSISFCAITANTIWEIRPSNGNDSNGAAFDSTIANAGTDYSNQNTAQLSVTDVTSNAAGTAWTSTTGGFTAAMIGNYARMNSGTGFTVGYYRITAVADTNNCTVDRDSSTTGSPSGGNISVGGAAATYGGQSTTTISGSIVAGNKIWVKNEAWNESMTLGISGSTGSPITMEGYNTTRGDAPTGSNRPTNNRASANGHGITVTGADWIIKNIVTSSSGGSGFMFNNNSERFINCRSTANGGSGFLSTGTPAFASFIQSQADLNSGSGFNLTTGSNQRFVIIGCEANNNTGIGIAQTTGGNGLQVVFTLSYANASDGINSGGQQGLFLNDTVDSNTGSASDGIQVLTTSGLVFLNSIYSNNGNYAINVQSSADGVLYIDYNDYSGNTTGTVNNASSGSNDLTLSPQFTGTPNFAIGTNMKAKAIPNTFPSGNSQGYIDIGAVQRKENDGGGWGF